MKRGTANFLGGSRFHLRRRVRKHFFKPARRKLESGFARAWRMVLGAWGHTCFVGITGSCGKTTTAELLVAILAREGRVRPGVGANTTDYIARTILKAGPWHRFLVSEVSAHQFGAIGRSVRILRPDIAVVTNIAADHYGEYRSLEATAAEKVKLLEALTAEGIAVLNADDEYVYAMRQRTRGRILSYGMSERAEVRGENVSSRWPQRLSMDVCHDGQRVRVQTRLVGEHWAQAVLAATAAARAAGVSLEHAAEVIATVDPISSRMSEHRAPGGVTFLRDDFKAPLWTVAACVDVLRKADAGRKILVIGSISDTPKSHRERQRAIIREALEVVDKIVFVGDCSRSALKARSSPDDDCIMAFRTLQECNQYLQDYLEAGDLVLLKGARKSDHFDRLVLSRTNNLACWRHACEKDRFCHKCRYQHTPAGPMEPIPVS